MAEDKKKKKKKKRYVEVAADECKGCALCVDACNKGCLEIGDKINSLGYRHAVFEGDKCVACGACFYVCPESGAIKVIEEDVDD